MTDRLWYLRRAVPWAALLGCLAGAAALMGAAHRWESFAGLGVPMVALLSAAAAAFLLDEPAVAVTAVTPRGGRWATTARLAAALLPAGTGTALLLGAPGPVDGPGWTLVLGGLVPVVLLVVVLGSRRQRPTPGSAVASAVVLLGLVPLTLAMLLDWRSPYPSPELGPGSRLVWTGALVVGTLGCSVAVAGPSGLRRRTGRAPRDFR